MAWTITTDQGFDQNYYLQVKAAQMGNGTTAAQALAAINAAGLTAAQHYSLYGYNEGLAPNAYYNADQYAISKAAEAKMSVADFQLAWYKASGSTNLYTHYYQYGAFEATVNPSTGFDDDKYYAAKATQMGGTTTAAQAEAAIKAAGLNAISHYQLYGKNENLSYTPTPAVTPVNAYTLTTGVDVATSNNFSGPLVPNALTGAQQMTLTNGDTLTGDGAASKLTAMLTGTAAGGAVTTSITTTGIENFSLQNVSSAAQTVNGTITGLKNVVMTQATDATTLGGLQTKLETLSLANTNGKDFTGLFASAALSGSADAITTTLSGIAGGIVTLGSASGTNGYETFNVKSADSANTIQSINDGANSSLANLVLSGNQSLTINSSTLGSAVTIDATLTKIDASGMAAATTGGTVPGVTIGGTFKTTAGIKGFNSFAPTTTTKGSVSFVGGAGDDSLFLTGANVDDRLTIDGGVGTDRVTINGATAASATGATLKNVEELKLSAVNGAAAGNGYGFGAATPTFNLANATGVNTIILDGIGTTAVTAGGGAANSGVVTINTLAQPTGGLTFNLVGDKVGESQSFNGITYTPSGVTGSSSVNVNIGNQGQVIGGTNAMTVGALTMTGVPSVTITGSDMAAGQTLTINGGLNTAALTSFTATTGGNFSSTNNIGVAAVSSADFSGVGGSVTNAGAVLTIGNAAGAAVTLAGTGNNNVQLTLAGTINGSNGSGAQTLTTLAGAVTLTGGSGADTITGVAGADTLTGNGGNDSIVGAAGADIISGGDGINTLNGGANGDTITYGGAGSTGVWVDNDATIADPVGSTTLTLAGGADVIVCSATDRIDLTGLTNTTAGGLSNQTAAVVFRTTATAANTVEVYRGNYVGGTFTLAAAGTDLALCYADAGTATAYDNAIIVTGVGGTFADAGTLAGGILTLA